MKNIVRKFESVAEFHKYLENGEVQPAFKDKQSSQRENDKYWSGTDTFSEAEDLLLYGDKETAKIINTESLRDLRDNIKKYMVRKSIYSSVVGFAPIVPAYLAGAPNCMVNMRLTKQPKKVVTVVYSDTAHGGVSAKEIRDTAAKVFAALLMIEARGVQVNFYSAVSSIKGGQKIGFFVKVKKAGQRFDLLRMVYPCVNPSWLRRHFFKFVEVTPGVSERFVRSYGCVCNGSQTEELSMAAKINADAVLTFEQCEDLHVDDIIKKIIK